MNLTTANLAHYLIRKGLLSRQSVVDGDFLTFDCSSRNRNFKVRRRSGDGLFVKQARSQEPQATASVRCEATCYWLASSHPDAVALRSIVPAFRLYDPSGNVLATTLLATAETVAEHHRRVAAFPPELGAALGRALGTYHHASAEALQAATASSVFQRQPPWILSLHRQPPALSGTVSGANAGLLGILRQFPEFPENLDRLGAAWQTTSLIHGDMKWDNCLVEGDAGNVRIVDWELADIGDPSWDAGAILQSYVAFWIFSLPVGQTSNAEELARGAQYPLERMQGAVRAFWVAYRESRGIGRDDAALLERTIRYAAARMVLTAYETMQFSTQLSPHARYLLQVSLNMLTRPREAARDLLSL
ncbi:MAG: phosphotransferase [Acetobacteraceae bacterium]